MRLRRDGEPLLAVGIPLPDVGASLLRDRAASTSCRARSAASGVSLLGAVAITTVARRPPRALWPRAGPCARWPTPRRPPRPSPAAGSTPGWSRPTTPTSQVLAASFNDMAAALQERVERDARFASDVSHELRSPLMTLAASVEVLQTRRDEMPERGRGRARPAGGRRRPLPGPGRGPARDLPLRRRRRPPEPRGPAGGRVRPPGREREHRCPTPPWRSTERAEDLVIQADKRRLARVVANLLDNARNYGGGEVDGHRRAEPAARARRSRTCRSPSRTTAPACRPRSGCSIFERFARGGVGGAAGQQRGRRPRPGPRRRARPPPRRPGVGRGPPRRRGGARFVIELPAEHA